MAVRSMPRKVATALHMEVDVAARSRAVGFATSLHSMDSTDSVLRTDVLLPIYRVLIRAVERNVCPCLASMLRFTLKMIVTLTP